MLDFEYKAVGVCIIICLIFSTVIFSASFLLGQEPDMEKVSVYECGFDPRGGPRIPFEVKFFLVGCLFLIFDLEIALIFPWSAVLPMVNLSAIWAMYAFLVILGVGLFYE